MELLQKILAQLEIPFQEVILEGQKFLAFRMMHNDEELLILTNCQNSFVQLKITDVWQFDEAPDLWDLYAFLNQINATEPWVQLYYNETNLQLLAKLAFPAEWLETQRWLWALNNLVQISSDIKRNLTEAKNGTD